MASDAERGPETLAKVKARGKQIAITHQLIDLAAQADPVRPWGRFQAAADHWGGLLGRAAPAPAVTDQRGVTRASPAAVEWVMGLPEGWVTDPGLGLSRRAQIKMLGNGVVPRQAVLALRVLLQAARQDPGRPPGPAGG
ncbi:MAG: hypothetical protein LBO20_01590 [Bifidobacteriaceae bacterium]|nr:hypothetical protein [Bifidobacteriaceae bacterium]